MSRAEEITQAALQYANNLDGIELTDEFRRNLCIALGQAFMKGAEWADEHKAEKDNALTWEDIKWIDEHILYVYKKTNLRDEELYKEVLKRFKEEKYGKQG